MCVDPVTATAIAATASAVGTVGEGIMAYSQGQAANKEYKAAANKELLNSAIEETQIRKDSRKFAAEQRLAALAGGGDVASGSASAVMDADARTLELNALMRRYSGETDAENLKQKGRNAKKAGKIAAAGKFMRAGVEAIGSFGNGDFDGFKKAA